MLTDQRKARRAQINKDFAEKQDKLGLKTYRFSLPEGAHGAFVRLAEEARARHYSVLAETLPDGAEGLLAMAKSNLTQPLPETLLQDAESADVGADLLSRYHDHLSALTEAENAAWRLSEAEDHVGAARHKARAYAASAWLRIYKGAILAQMGG